MADPQPAQGKPCRCHSSMLYLSLVECPACGHWSLDRLPGWEGCERRACGYQRVLMNGNAIHESGLQ
jgi:hypothetical protein